MLLRMNCIANNPYRIFGVWVNASQKERLANQNRINAFLKIGKTVSFPNDLTDLIGESPARSIDSVNSANIAINLDKDRLKHALFWFINTSPFDEMALKYLQQGNSDKAKEIFTKNNTTSSLLNLGVLAFIENNLADGFRKIEKVIHDETHRENLLSSLGLTTLSISADALAELYITKLLEEIRPMDLWNAAENLVDKSIICQAAIKEPTAFIYSTIDTAKSVQRDNPQANLRAGTILMESTKSALKQVKEFIGNTPEYQTIADSLAKQILQCGINYYTDSADFDKPLKAMKLLEYALRIAVGDLTKDRCQKNCDALKKVIDEMPPKEVFSEVQAVKAELKSFCKERPAEITWSYVLLINTKPYLQAIKATLGATHPFYLKLSTQVVANALHNIIEEVNHLQDQFTKNHAPIERYLMIDQLSNAFKAAWGVMIEMDDFAKETAFLPRYNQNRETLYGLYLSVCNKRPPTPESSPKEDNSGCWFVVIAVAVVIGIIIISTIS